MPSPFSLARSPARSLSPQGGVGKTSLAASLAVQFAYAGFPTLVVSTDPAHSLSDSLAQDVGGGQPVSVDIPGGGAGDAADLYGMEVDVEDAQSELKAFAGSDAGKQGAAEFMSGMGLGAFADQARACGCGCCGLFVVCAAGRGASRQGGSAPGDPKESGCS